MRVDAVYLGSFLPFVMTMKVTGFSKMLLLIYQSTRRHMLKDHIIAIQCPENLRSHEFICPSQPAGSYKVYVRRTFSPTKCNVNCLCSVCGKDPVLNSYVTCK